MVELGHVALRVRELERAIEFYRQAVGLNIVGRIGGGRAADLFFPQLDAQGLCKLQVSGGEVLVGDEHATLVGGHVRGDRL